MNDMGDLHSVLMLPAGARKPRRRLETPSKTQSEVLTALGWRVCKRRSKSAAPAAPVQKCGTPCRRREMGQIFAGYSP